MKVIHLTESDADSAAVMIASYCPGDNQELIKRLQRGSPGLDRWSDFSKDELRLLARTVVKNAAASDRQLVSEILREMKRKVIQFPAEGEIQCIKR